MGLVAKNWLSLGWKYDDDGEIKRSDRERLEKDNCTCILSTCTYIYIVNAFNI